MSPSRGTCFELARVTIEFSTPSRVGAGGWDPLHDAFFATDANELPALPGTSIAGVLRHAAADAWHRDIVEDVFGFQRGSAGRPSRLEVSWAHVHGADDRPVPFLGAAEDPVLAALAAGVVRDHVRIGARGTVDGRGKFDELVVPAGARFTFELVLHAGADPSLADLLALLASPAVRLGAGGRKGLGRFAIVRAVARRFDLTRADDRAAFSRLPRGLHEPVPAEVLRPIEIRASSAAGRWVTGRLLLEPLDYWSIGRGDPWRPEHEKKRKGEGRVEYVDHVPVEEPRIVWEGGRGRVAEREPAVPASAVKGALRHRAAWHARVGRKAFFAPDQAAEGVGTAPEDVPEVVALFGAIKDGDDGQPGRVLVSDGRARGYRFGRLDHVSLDRFTQGPLDHLLFSEVPLFGGTIELDLAVDARGLDADAKRILARALADLCEGRLPIGAGASRGHGYCRGRIEWTDGRGLDT